MFGCQSSALNKVRATGKSRGIENRARDGEATLVAGPATPTRNSISERIKAKKEFAPFNN
jgi:hypothetical protein